MFAVGSRTGRKTVRWNDTQVILRKMVSKNQPIVFGRSVAYIMTKRFGISTASNTNELLPHKNVRLMHMGRWNHLGRHVPSLERVLGAQGNSSCCDCSDTEISYINVLNSGVYCKRCTGIQQEIGIDAHFIPLNEIGNLSHDEIKYLSKLGNEELNNIYEHLLRVLKQIKPDKDATTKTLQTFIKRKYIDCAFSLAHCDPTSTKNVLNFVSHNQSQGKAMPNLKYAKPITAAHPDGLQPYDTMLDDAFDEEHAIILVHENDGLI